MRSLGPRWQIPVQLEPGSAFLEKKSDRGGGLLHHPSFLRSRDWQRVHSCKKLFCVSPLVERRDEISMRWSLKRAKASAHVHAHIHICTHM